jgi:alkaline phosphatase
LADYHPKFKALIPVTENDTNFFLRVLAADARELASAPEDRTSRRLSSTVYEEQVPSPGWQFPSDLKEITREHTDRVLGLWASRQLAARLRHARDEKLHPSPSPTPCAWLQAGRELS